MYIGAISSAVRQVVANFAAKINRPVLLAGAGNFTIAAALRAGGYSGTITACDISLYTSALGAYLSGCDPDIQERPDAPEQLRGLLRFDTPEDQVCSLALIYDLRDIWKADNPWKRRELQNHRAEWDSLLARAKTRLVAFKAAIGEIDYYPGCAFDLLEQHGSAHTICGSPPTYRAGYERLEELLRATVIWQPPRYREFTDTTLDFYNEVARFDAWMIILEKDLPEVYDILGRPAAMLPRGRGRVTYILTRTAERPVIIRPHVKSEAIGPMWPAGRPIYGDEKLALTKITLGQSLHMNELYLSSRIDYFTGGVNLSLGIVMNNHVIGKADLARSYEWKKWSIEDSGAQIYMMSDLAVPWYTKGLSKLVLMALLSREAKELMDQRFIDDIHHITTTAFSRHPTSMKYRGLFKLHSRSQTSSGYSLNYYAKTGQWAIVDVIELWKKRYKYAK